MRQPSAFGTLLRFIFWGSLILSVTFPIGAFAGQALEWPRLVETEKGRILVYQPQLESFTGNKLNARAAVSVTLKEKTPVFGAVWIEARVSTDRDFRTITFEKIRVTDARFPDASEKQLAELKKRLEWAMPKWTPTVSLDRVLAMMELVEKEQASSESLKNDPPVILMVDHPAVLVTLDGEPKLSKMEKSSLMRVVNTPFFIVMNPDDRNWYLKGDAGWLAAGAIKGPWETAEKVPGAVAASVKASGDDKKIKQASMHRIIVSTVPTELIQTKGAPLYTPISQTGLLYVSNTESDLFVEIATQRHFVLISGRWYAARDLSGKWVHVSPEDLPEDFAKIPEGSPKGTVLAAVPGTTRAREAVLDTHIPQTAAIRREEKGPAVNYDGPPKFVQVQGTTMMYAENTPFSVLKVDGAYYACHQAVWYRSSNPSGPWVVCVEVPPVIYTLPPSCPIYSVKYVRVYDYTPSVVYVGYTPGYVGCYVSGGVVVYGTGYVYRGWHGRVYYPRPITWGAAVRYNPHTGNWAFAAGRRGYHGGWAAVGVVGGGAVHGGWWGYGGYRGRYGEREVDIDRSITTPRGTITDSINIERDWDGDIDIDRNVGFEPNENIYNRAENRERLAESEAGKKLGERTAGKEGRRTGEKGTAGMEARGTAGKEARRSAEERAAGTADRAASATSGSQRAAKSTNNVYADKKGDVFKRTDQGWQKRSSAGWNKSTGTTRSGNLNRDYRARERGNQRTRSFNSSRGGGRGSVGRRGGGRRR